jgi:hypothetical protein
MATSVSQLIFNRDALAHIFGGCRSFFGSAVRGELRPDSNLDFWSNTIPLTGLGQPLNSALGVSLIQPSALASGLPFFFPAQKTHRLKAYAT